MNEKALRVLEYPKIIQKLTDYAGSQPGKELCRNLTPSSDLTQIRRMQRETSDAVSRLLRKGNVSFSGLADIRLSLRRLEVGSSLNVEELLRVAKLLETTSRVKAWSRSAQASLEEQNEDSLEEMFTSLQPLTPLSHEINRCIPSEEEIADDASPGLKQVRRQMHQANDRIRAQLNAMVNGGTRNYLQDAVITQRNGRFCIPVKAEYRSQVPGMIHDQSSTGSTLFIEPMAVVKLNNDLRELEIKEEKEIEIVLANLSGQVAVNSDAINDNILLMTELDFIFARAQLSLYYKGSEPDFNEEGRVRIKKGRHPLLDPKKVVPVDIRIGEDFTMLVISGPNTGGKTVSLKTVGLFTLLGQSGLHIPASDHSELAIFDEIYADIGDEQSIEQSLSTFSAHMTNIVSFWDQADERSLVLFDELGAGTDPTEGAALAISILSNLHRRNVRTIATTHYSELKIYALSTDQVENASCEFDVESLQPTYRLLIGVPGKSNAFAISSKLGISDDIIEKAKSLVDEDAKSFEDVVTGLESTRKELEEERAKAAAYREEIERQKKKLAEKNERIDKAKEKILRRANEEANEILQKAKDMADDSIRKYNKWMDGGKGNVSDMERQRSAIREQLKKTGEKLATKQKGNRPKTAPGKLSIGDLVMVHSMGVKGTVMSLPNAKGKCFVQMGIMRSEVNADDLELLEEETLQNRKEQLRERSGAGKIKMMKSLQVSSSINLIGKTVDEAIALLDKYLDDAYLAKLHQITIIHGVGTGALRNAVQAHLKKSKYIKTYRMGEYGEGGYGVTVAEFK